MSLTLTSTEFASGHDIPARYTCDGRNISPPLSWSSVPPATRSLALIVEDPDAPDPASPQRTWVHWLLYNIPSNIAGLKQAVTRTELPDQMHEGMNDWHRTGYDGPCPPVGRHRYFFKLYALDISLPDLQTPDKTILENAMQKHILEKTELIGLYQRRH